MAKKCKVCGEDLNKTGKENRTEHYGCRNIKVLSKKGMDKTCKTREISALKTMEKKPSLFKIFFGF